MMRIDSRLCDGVFGLVVQHMSLERPLGLDVVVGGGCTTFGGSGGSAGTAGTFCGYAWTGCCCWW